MRRAASRGGDEDELSYLVRVAQGDVLGHIAAERDANHVDSWYVERARHTGYVVGQISYGIGLIHTVAVAHIAEVHGERAVLCAEDRRLIAPALAFGAQSGKKEDRPP